MASDGQDVQDTPSTRLNTERNPSPRPSRSGWESTSTEEIGTELELLIHGLDGTVAQHTPADQNDAAEEGQDISLFDHSDANHSEVHGFDSLQTGHELGAAGLEVLWPPELQNASEFWFDWEPAQSETMAMEPPRRPFSTPRDNSSLSSYWASPIVGNSATTRSRSPTLSTSCRLSTPLSAGIFDLQGQLIDVYFNTVCRIFSTFDSPQNLFRSYVSRKWQSSSAMFYAMLSMASAKLGRQSLTYKRHASEYQSLAIKQLSEIVSTASSWTPELLFVVLMLGLSTSWHDVSDLGLVHLHAMQRAIFDSPIECADDEFQTLDFFKQALTYWEMVTSWVTEDVPAHDYSGLIPCPRKQTSSRASDPSNMERLKPHPWASIAQQPQALFTHLVRLIRQLRSFSHGSKTPKSHLTEPETFLKEVEALENEMWKVELPSLHEIAHTGDENTPAIDHLLLAEAYMFANFYQLYQVFPNLSSKHDRHLNQPNGSRSQMQNLTMMSSALSHLDANSDDWLKFLGHSIIIRLDQIHSSSGTSCVQPLLLLVGSTSLSIEPDSRGSGKAGEILRMRKSLLDRLSFISAACLSEPIHTVELAVKEIFKRLDVGVNVFWMDMLQDMGLVTIIG